MGDDSKIEWTDATWNPVTGCTKVSPGCDHCYIERTPPFRIEGRRFDLPTIGGTTGVRLHHARLDQPLRWQKPRRIFVNSLSDVFHEDVPDEYLVQMFDVMANARRHTFQVLTKRHARMRTFMRRYTRGEFGEVPEAPAVGVLPNVWLGVTVENQQWAGIRIPALLDTPAAVRFLSCEPLLGPVGLCCCYPSAGAVNDASRSMRRDACPLHGQDRIDWVIVGGESGPGARPMDVDWARSLRDQCTAARVPFHFKQWGEWYDGERLGKREAGRILDGRTWDEFPAGIG